MSALEIRASAAIVLSALLFIFLERVFPATRGQNVLRSGFFNDLTLYTIAQSYVLGIVIFSGIVRWLDDLTMLSSLGLLTSWPLWIQLLFFTVTHDLYIYWMHRWQHRNRFLWRIHEAHHSCTEVDWLAGSRSHALEILINQTVEFAPVVLLGASPEVIPLKGLISAVWGMFIHANIAVRLGPFRYIVNGPEMHRWHHAVGKGRNNNFATKLAVWDWLFGTGYLPGGPGPGGFGLKHPFPSGYLQQFMFAFRPFHRERK